MAGYMTKLYGNLYEGELINGTNAPVKNGMLLVIDSTGTKLVLPAADTNTKFIVKEVTTIYGSIPAVRYIAGTQAKQYYFVENGADFNDSLPDYDLRDYEVAPNKFLRAHPILPGEELLVSVDSTSGITVGSQKTVKATGLIG